MLFVSSTKLEVLGVCAPPSLYNPSGNDFLRRNILQITVQRWKSEPLLLLMLHFCHCVMTTYLYLAVLCVLTIFGWWTIVYYMLTNYALLSQTCLRLLFLTNEQTLHYPPFPSWGHLLEEEIEGWIFFFFLGGGREGRGRKGWVWEAACVVMNGYEFFLAEQQGMTLFCSSTLTGKHCRWPDKYSDASFG